VLIFLLIFSGNTASSSQKDGESNVVFLVRWYDVGKEALEGLKGVKKVEKGFHNSKEINTVYYDPNVITIEEMEMALKKAGTYLGTLEWMIGR
jgi:copper chaperone CopZ